MFEAYLRANLIVLNTGTDNFQRSNSAFTSVRDSIVTSYFAAWSTGEKSIWELQRICQRWRATCTVSSNNRRFSSVKFRSQTECKLLCGRTPPHCRMGNLIYEFVVHRAGTREYRHAMSRSRQKGLSLIQTHRKNTLELLLRISQKVSRWREICHMLTPGHHLLTEEFGLVRAHALMFFQPQQFQQ